jgi:hypothetical protein
VRLVLAQAQHAGEQRHQHDPAADTEKATRESRRDPDQQGSDVFAGGHRSAGRG